MKYFTKTILASLMLGTISTHAFATPTQGSLGATSTGSADISVTVPNLAKITGVADLVNSSFNGTGGFDMNQDVCVYSNAANSYTVKITGSGNPKSTSPTDPGFFVGNALTDQELAYSVKWNDATGTSGESAVTSGVDLTGQGNMSTDEACSGSTNANYHVVMTHAGLLALHPGTYTGTITIVITPV